jgi:hypothetical protein
LIIRVEGGIGGTASQAPVGSGIKGRPPKVTNEQFREYLDKNPGATPQSIATAFGISPSGAYDRLAKLKKAIPLTNPALAADPAIKNHDIPMLEAEPDEDRLPVEDHVPDIGPEPDPKQGEPSLSYGPADDQGDDDAAKADDTDGMTDEERESRRERLAEAHKQMPTFETEEERQKREMEILGAFV